MSSDDKPNQVWTNPDSEKDELSLVWLKPGVLCLGVVPADDLKKTAAAVTAGADLVAQNIPLAMIEQLQGDKGESDLSVTYKQGEGHTHSVTITLADSEKRDQLLDALRVYLGPTWTCERQRVSRLSASLWPLGLTALIALVTWVMYTEAQAIAAGRHLNPVAVRAKTSRISETMH
jgi:hypothetical protein